MFVLQLETPTSHVGSGKLENGTLFRMFPAIGNSHGSILHLPPWLRWGGRTIDSLSKPCTKPPLNPTGEIGVLKQNLKTFQNKNLYQFAKIDWNSCQHLLARVCVIMYTIMVQSCKPSRSTIEQKSTVERNCWQLFRVYQAGKVNEIGTSSRVGILAAFSQEKRPVEGGLRGCWRPRSGRIYLRDSGARLPFSGK